MAECDICQREGHSAKVCPKRGKYLKCVMLMKAMKVK